MQKNRAMYRGSIYRVITFIEHLYMVFGYRVMAIFVRQINEKYPEVGLALKKVLSG